ncbi:hypothetical protein LJC46_04595 [Desulfovibrio sp. OttesenSCG-928-G15]|nr:hypothetical protein [Desulfovibrio sp. OttesenSCG-928-G15]
MTQSMAHTLHIPLADPAWKLLMQSGVVVRCTVGITFDLMLRREFGLTEEQIAPVDSIILDGMPVDEPEHTVVPGGSRLALASGLPGITGLSMKKGSAVRGLRSGITHTRSAEVTPTPGEITLSLYSLTLPELAGHFLARGVGVTPEQLVRYSRFALEDAVLLDKTPYKAKELAGALAGFPADCRIALTAFVMS